MRVAEEFIGFFCPNENAGRHLLASPGVSVVDEGLLGQLALNAFNVPVHTKQHAVWRALACRNDNFATLVFYRAVESVDFAASEVCSGLLCQGLYVCGQ